MTETTDSTVVELRPAAKRAPSPNDIAARIRGRHRFITDMAGITWRYTGTHWVQAPEGYLRRLAWDEEGDKYSDAKRRSEIVAAIADATAEHELQWGRVGEREIACRNGVVDAMTGAITPHRAQDYLQRVLPWDFDPQARCDLWLKCLHGDWFADDKEGREMVGALQEFFGYIAMQHARYKKAAILPGESNSGKSQVIAAAMDLVGHDACCTLGVEDMDDPQRRSVLIGKALNVMTELSADALLKDGGFKTLVSTEEPIMIDPKWVKPFMYVSTAKHMIAANNLPALVDRSEGTFNRLLIIPFERIIRDRDQDPYLRDKLRDEMPGILAWAVAGAKRLIERQGRWPAPELSERMLKAYRAEQNPATYFIDECFVKDDTAAEMLAVITAEFNRWSHGQKTSNRKLAELLRRHLGPRAIRKVRMNGRSVRCLIGYRFSGQLRSATVEVDPEEVEMSDELDGGKLSEHGSDGTAGGSAGANGGKGARDDGV